MSFLWFIKGQDFLIIYAIFAIIGIIIISKILKNNDSKDFIISDLDEEKTIDITNDGIISVEKGSKTIVGTLADITINFKHE